MLSLKCILKKAIADDLETEKLSQRNIASTCQMYLMQKQFLPWAKKWLLKHEFADTDTVMQKLECLNPDQWFTKDTVWQGKLGESSMEAALWIYDIVFTKK